MLPRLPCPPSAAPVAVLAVLVLSSCAPAGGAGAPDGPAPGVRVTGPPVSAAASTEVAEGRVDTVTSAVAAPRFHASIAPVPAAVAARSTWHEGCPVALADLAYVTVTIRGFDGRANEGELIVRADVADHVASAFAALFDARFPIEELRVTSEEDLDREPAGDENASESFVCRPVTGGTSWSQHAYGLAIDLNPRQNPYVRGDVVLPPGADAFLDRDRIRPGMIVDGGVVVRAFAAIGWGWGGHWSGLSDYQHFSRSGT